MTTNDQGNVGNSKTVDNIETVAYNSSFFFSNIFSFPIIHQLLIASLLHLFLKQYNLKPNSSTKWHSIYSLSPSTATLIDSIASCVWKILLFVELISSFFCLTLSFRTDFTTPKERYCWLVKYVSRDCLIWFCSFAVVLIACDWCFWNLIWLWIILCASGFLYSDFAQVVLYLLTTNSTRTCLTTL